MPPVHITLCPRCSSNRIKRSHSRGIIEKALKMINIRAYRCIHCGWRGYRLYKGSAQGNRANYSLLQIIALAIFVTLAVMLLLYYLTREEPKETFSYKTPLTHEPESLPRKTLKCKT
jgi:hypothetical protein